MAKRVCETVSVTFTDEAGVSATWTLPAYTVEATILRSRVARLMDDYMRASAARREPVSLADFLMFLVPQAARDPREIQL